MNVAILLRKPFAEMGEWGSIFNETEQVAVYCHTPDMGCKAEHIHMLLMNFSRKEDTLRNRIKSLGFSKSDYAIKTKNDRDGGVVNDNFLCYMSKGKLLPRYVKGFSTELLERRRGEWVDRVATVQLQSGKLVKVAEEKKQKTKKQLLELMIAEIPDRGGRMEVLEAIRKVLVRENQVIGMYKMLDYYDSYFMYERKESWLDGMCAKLNSRLGI